jgi:hypothetical protein
LHSLIASRPTATDLARGPLLPPRVDRRRCQTNRKNGSGRSKGFRSRGLLPAANKARECQSVGDTGRRPMFSTNCLRGSLAPGP